MKFNIWNKDGNQGDNNVAMLIILTGLPVCFLYQMFIMPRDIVMNYLDKSVILGIILIGVQWFIILYLWFLLINYISKKMRK